MTITDPEHRLVAIYEPWIKEMEHSVRGGRRENCPWTKVVLHLAQRHIANAAVVPGEDALIRIEDRIQVSDPGGACPG